MGKTNIRYDVIIIGAGAAGLMCAIETGKRGRSVLVLEHGNAVGKKIRISGGGRCNFTNFIVDHNSYISSNPHFCKSALSRYSPAEFISLIEKHGIAYREKTLGQLFCDNGAQEILSMLLKECADANVEIVVNCRTAMIRKDERFTVETNLGSFESSSLVVATGGLSIPKIGATDFGYSLAKKFKIRTTELKPGLVPLLWSEQDRAAFSVLSGVSFPGIVSCGKIAFEESILFTHKGLSGPAILQISSYWSPGKTISINLLPACDIESEFQEQRESKQLLLSILSRHCSRRFIQRWLEVYFSVKPMNRYSNRELQSITGQLRAWQITPADIEGYEKAEVTVGGIDTDELSSKTMEAKKMPGLYFIGEVVDVTGHLGGYNFQWAWASGYAAGQYV
jgi:predicted Rossmann fold flavoprotein